MTILLFAGLVSLAPVSPPSLDLILTDTFEIVLTPHSYQGQIEGPVRIDADELTTSQYGLLDLRRDNMTVGLIQWGQIVFIANCSVEGDRIFVIETAQESYSISADYMEATHRNGLIRFWTGDRLVGVVQSSQVRYVADASARVGPGGRP